MIYHALIRTHHITSRKKVAALKAAAKKYACAALLRSGGAPGIMYVRGEERGVEGWVGVIHVGLVFSLFWRAGGMWIGFFGLWSKVDFMGFLCCSSLSTCFFALFTPF